MVVFLVVLLVGYAYVWVKGDLDWDKPQPVAPKLNRTLTSEIKTERPSTVEV
jgi:NADH-quinone oxidoreductase subunit A